MASNQNGRVVDASWTGKWTGENRANTGNGRIGRVGHQNPYASSLLDEISDHWSQFIVSTTPHAAEILTLTAAASYLLHIPDPEGPEVQAASDYQAQVRDIKSGSGTPKEKSAAIDALGEAPKVPMDPRLKKIKDKLGLRFFPILGINAPVEGCGKSNATKALQLLSRRVELEMGSTYASVRDTKTAGYGVVIDEAQRTFRRGGDTQADWEQLLNSSFELSAAMPKKMIPVDRMGSLKPKKFPQFGMLALAGIGLRLPGDNASRVIWLNLLRVDMDQVSHWEGRDQEPIFAEYGERLEHTFSPMLEAAYSHREPMPPEIRGRLGDKWSPLIITADLAGGRWPALARKIAVDSINIENGNRPEQVDERAKAYADIAEVWEPETDRITSAVLIDRLKEHDPETYGWIKSVSEGGGKQLSGLLRNSDFRSPKSRTSGSFRGWFRRDFEPAWTHYERLRGVPVQPVQSVQSPDSRGSDPSTDPSNSGTNASISPCDVCWKNPATVTESHVSYCHGCYESSHAEASGE